MRAPPKVPTILFEHRPERGSWRWLTGSVLAHALIIVALVVDWHHPAPFAVDTRTPGDPGPLGGGGGGGGEYITYVQLPAWDQPAETQEQEKPQDPNDLVLPIPEVQEVKVEVEMPRFELPKVVPERGGTVLGRGPGTGGGPGAGTGTGGGVGSGTGTGIGSHTGPGTGGEGGDVFTPVPRYVEMPGLDPKRPGSVRGKEYVAKLVISPEGVVESVEIQPTIRDGDYRQRVIAMLYRWTFAPALTRDGRRVRAEVLIPFSL